MARIRIRNFLGKAPRYSAKELPENYAQTATNCDFRKRTLKPIKSISTLGTIAKAGSIAKIFKVEDNSWTGVTTDRWECWTHDSDIVRCWADGTYHRIIWTYPAGLPRQGREDGTLHIIDCFTAATASDYYRLGVPKPTAYPSTSKSGSAGSDIQDTASYVCTYVTTWGEESEPSEPSNVAGDIIYDGEYVNISLTLTAGDFTDCPIATVRFYRLSTGTTGADYQYLGEDTSAIVAGGTATFQDKGSGNEIIASANLGEAIQTEGWTAPPTGILGFVSYANGMIAGFKDKSVYFCEPYIYYAFPADYIKEVKDDIVALGHYGETLIVTTVGETYYATGIDPQSSVLKPIEDSPKNVSKKGLVSTRFGVLYPSPDGLILIDQNGWKNITEGVILPEDWSALTPSGLIGAFWNDKYVGFFSGTDNGIVYDFKTDPYLIDTDIGIDSADDILDVFVAPDNNVLYLLYRDDSESDYLVVAWEGSASYLTATWKSKKFETPFPINFSCCQIIGSQSAGSPCVFNLWADGVLKVTNKSVTDSKPFALPSKYTATVWEVQVAIPVEIEEIVFATSVEELANE